MSKLPEKVMLELVRMPQWELRYGENPHQNGAMYKVEGQTTFWDKATFLREPRKAMGYLNFYDATAAYRMATELGNRPTCVVVKHANPCGVAIRNSVVEAYEAARDCDPTSAFGGIVAVNQPVTVAMAEAMMDLFIEVLIAPDYEEGVLDVWKGKKPDLRILVAPHPELQELHYRDLGGGNFMIQEWDPVTIDRAKWEVVTEAQPTEQNMVDAEFGIRVAARVVSNAIVLALNEQAWVGCGQPNRKDSGVLACQKAGGHAKGGVYVSEAFFPFPDGLDGAIEAGASCVVQPGGSNRDEEVITYANENGLAMIFIGERHFKH